ncbi:Clostripain precursor [compost metagenome]
MNKHVTWLSATLAAAVLLSGCGVTPIGSLLGGDGRVQGQSTGAPWSLLTFFALDNDLDHGTGIVNRLHAASQRAANVASVTFYDGAKNNDTIYVYETAPGVSAKTANQREADSGTSAALDEFVTFAAKTTPAQRRALSMADHGGGIVRGICSDWNGPGGKKIIHMNEVAQVLEKTPVEIMMFDACFMQMAEVGYELRKGAKVLIAAQTTTRGDFPYENIVKVLDSNPKADSRQIATQLLDVIAANARYEVAFGAMDITQSEELARRMGKLSDVLLLKLKDRNAKKAIASAIRGSMAYANETSPGMTMYNNYRDLLDVMANLSKVGDAEITAAAQAVTEAAKASIIGERHRNAGFLGGELNLDKASGLAIYAQVDGPVESKYLQRAWNRDTRWGDFLAQLNSGGSWGPAVQQDKYPYAFPSRN